MPALRQHRIRNTYHLQTDLRRHDCRRVIRKRQTRRRRSRLEIAFGDTAQTRDALCAGTGLTPFYTRWTLAQQSIIALPMRELGSFKPGEIVGGIKDVYLKKQGAMV